MTHVCKCCHRVSPPDAAFCYHDGAPLDGASVPSGHTALNIAGHPFALPLVFSSGRSCHNFNELALACHGEPSVALEMLRKGHLESFLAGQGRVDLAEAAHTARNAPDRLRGLDDFLGRLPGSALAPAKLRVEPTTLDLGTMRPREERLCELVLHNEGTRLLYGSATCSDHPWLSFGDKQAKKEKLFQFSDRLVLPLRIRGRYLAAYHEPLAAEIRLQSNGGTIVVPVHVNVPVQPFPSGVLMGATTPRQLAEKARSTAGEAAALVESGAVARWYKDNGWAYPVQGPTVAGVNGLQQLFEALGLVKAPKAELSEDAIDLFGAAGESLEHVLVVLTQENRLIVAHATSDQPWLRVGRTVFRGRSAFLPLNIAAVPARTGETLQAHVTVIANGNQRFVVPVTLMVGSHAPGGKAAAALGPPVKPAVPVPPVAKPAPAGKVEAAPVPHKVAVPAPPAKPAAAAAVKAEAVPVPPPKGAVPMPPPAKPATAPPAKVQPLPSPPAKATVPVAKPAPDAAPPVLPRSPVLAAEKPGTPPAQTFPPRPKVDSRRMFLSLAPALLLVATIFGVVLRDYFKLGEESSSGPTDQPLDPTPRIEIRFHDDKKADDLEALYLNDPQPTMRFGVVMLSNGKPVGSGLSLMRLTFDQWGRTNNTCLRFDGTDERLFGSAKGFWREFAAKGWKDAQGKDHDGTRSVWECADKAIQVTQFVELVRGEQSRLLDTCQVRYLIENQDKKDHQVGIRFLLDTYIGGNDGVPFTIPGAAALCDTDMDLPKQAKDKKVPDFLQALEKPNLSNPGTIAHLKLKLDDLEAPARVTLGVWPDESLRVNAKNADGPLTMWDVPVLPIKTLSPPDSAVTIYWEEKPLKAGASRTVGFEYGLFQIASKDSRLALAVAGARRPGGQLTVVAYMDRTGLDNDATLTLSLPDGFGLLEGAATQKIPEPASGARSAIVPVTWKVQAGPVGKYLKDRGIKVTSSTRQAQTVDVEIQERIFD
jgi:hypothetical protein